MTPVPDQRILLVHAHPDDETIQNGATMAKYVADGRGVTLVTCTAGEMGEILVPELEHLAADKEDGLGRAPARRARGRDEGARRSPTTASSAGSGSTATPAWRGTRTATRSRPTTSTRTPSGTPTSARPPDYLVEVIREVRPQVLVTYDQFGNYGHPDHIQAHRVATYAASLAAVPSYKRDLGAAWDIPKIYWSAMAESRFRAMLRRLREAGDTETFEGMDPDGDFGPCVTPTRTSAPASTAADVLDDQAGRAGAAPQPGRRWTAPFFRGSENGQSMFGEEFYRIAKGEPGPLDADGWENDLFAGSLTHPAG